jgi:hypothetical protein
MVTRRRLALERMAVTGRGVIRGQRVWQLAAVAGSFAAIALPGSATARAALTPSRTFTVQRAGATPHSPRRTTRRMLPLRVPNPARYSAQKAAANRAYRRLLQRHPSGPSTSARGPALGGPLVVVFDGLNWSGPGANDSGGATPPDPTGAIGPGAYVEFVNSRISVYDRTAPGSPTSTVDEDTFTGSSSTCDAQIKWDQQAGRFEYASLDCGSAAGGEGFSFGWSKTSNPTDLANGWCKYHVDTGYSLEDYPKLGNDDNFLILGTNAFDDTAGYYTGSHLFVLGKPAVGDTSCPLPAATEFTLPSDAFTPEPANVFGSSDTGFVVATKTTQDALRFFRVTGTTAPTLTDDGDISVPAFAVPASVPQPDTFDVLDSSDTRLTQAVAAVDPGLGTMAVWTQHTVAGPEDGPAVDRWYELRPGSSTPVQTGTVQDPSGNFVFNGAIAPTQDGGAVISYNVGGAGQLPDLRASSRAAATAPGTMGSEITLATSSAADTDFSCFSDRGSCRWGDYAGASIDPNNPSVVWGTGELTGPQDGGNAQWATQNFALSENLSPTASFTFAPTSPTTGQAVAFDGTRSSDPGGSIDNYSWDFGDGSTASGPNPSHSYPTAGSYTVRLNVTDNRGLSDTTSNTITVTSPPPTGGGPPPPLPTDFGGGPDGPHFTPLTGGGGGSGSTHGSKHRKPKHHKRKHHHKKKRHKASRKHRRRPLRLVLPQL